MLLRNKYAKLKAPQGLPPSSELEGILKEVEARLSLDPKTVFERLRVMLVNGLAFLWGAQRTPRQQPTAHHLVRPKDPHPLLEKLLGVDSKTPPASHLHTPAGPNARNLNHPIIVPAVPLHSTDFAGHHSVHFSGDDLADHKVDHRRLLAEIAVFKTEGKGVLKVWSVNCLTGGDVYYYVVFADEGAEAAFL
ncbi:hypothetical protein B0H19DRAFT_1269967 [Mycena capillaripes]|nr:hypothetical protein B0H19DRAFT_1269967 [Mycena capillaripes]